MINIESYNNFENIPQNIMNNGVCPGLPILIKHRYYVKAIS